MSTPMWHYALLCLGLFFATYIMCNLLFGCATIGQHAADAASLAVYKQDLERCRFQGRQTRSYLVYEMCAEEADRAVCQRSGVQCKEGGDE